MNEDQVQWGVKTSNGKVRECESEGAAKALLSQSKMWGVTPQWSLVKRQVIVTDWKAA